MKNIFAFSIITLLLCINCAIAQDTSFSKSLVNGKKNKYAVKLGSHDKHIANNSNHLLTDKNRKMPVNPLPIHSKDYSFDKGLLTDILHNTFSESRLKKLSNENLQLLVLCNVDPNGNVLEVFFSMPSQSTLKPTEIEDMESKIKSGLKYTLNYNVFKDYSFYTFSFNVDFKRLYLKEDKVIY